MVTITKTKWGFVVCIATLTSNSTWFTQTFLENLGFRN